MRTARLADCFVLFNLGVPCPLHNTTPAIFVAADQPSSSGGFIGGAKEEIGRDYKGRASL